MSHELTINSNGQADMAYIGDKPWHGLGHDLSKWTPEQLKDVRAWAKAVHMDYELKRAQAQFFAEGGEGLDLIEFPGQEIIYRSDTLEPMSTVSGRYQIVQPLEILDFFERFVEAGDMTLETVGSLQGGRKIWALAKLGEDFDVNEGRTGAADLVKSYCLIATSCDKSMATTGMLTGVRVVCNNTLQMSLSAGGSAAVKVPHSTKFDPQKVKADMGLVKAAIPQHAKAMRKMQGIGVNDEQAMRFFIELLKTPEEKKTGKVDLDTKRRALPKIWESYKGAPGAQDTVWGLVNGVTHAVDYNKHARSDDTRLNSAWFGAGAAQKNEAYALAQDESFLEGIIEKTNGVRALDNSSAIDSILEKVAV